MREIEKINNRISFPEKLVDPGNIEEEERYLENARGTLKQDMKDLKKYLIQPRKLESLAQTESETEEEG